VQTQTVETNHAVHSVRHAVGIWLREEHTFVRIAGSDAASWLHSQTTNDLEGLNSGEGNHNAILDRQGRLLGHFTLHRWEDEFWMLIENAQVDTVLKHLDDHLFIEDVQVERTDDSLEQLVIQGPRTMTFLSSCMDDRDAMRTALLPVDWYGVHPVELFGFEVLAFRISITGEDGFVFIGESGECTALLEKCCEHSAETVDSPVVVPDEAQEALRIETGQPKFNVDMDSTYRIPETTLERTAISYEKGCYLGQEVVARLKAYGTVKQALMGLIFSDGFDVEDWTTGCSLHVDGQSIGRGMSAVYSPTLEKNIALAYLDREHRTPGTKFSIQIDEGDGTVEAEVQTLPLYHARDREEIVQSLYHDALDLFQADLDDNDASAIPMLTEAILLQPDFEDAYEVLGVILNRHHRVDEAIYYMNRLKELNPNCLMAHSNLSVFYLAKGMIEEAEIAKAQSAVLQMQNATDERKAKEIAAEERERIQNEAQDRIEMFKEVLEIDEDDPVATFGLGKAYVQLNQYENAIPHLIHATEVQKDFSAAFLDLGKCYEFLEKNDLALETYAEGIAVASKKGDLMPMREMERRQKSLADIQTTDA
jgi:folate-binding protein YgfZ